jgi:endonuclease/exonuclease/phosphatase family metal-dependent hydrolase
MLSNAAPASSKMTSKLRVMTYNVHGCVGVDLRFLPERIARVIEAASPDVVAMQELYVEHPRFRGLNQAAWLAERLEMHFEFGAARECEGGGRYGNAVLSRLPLRSVRAHSLPQWRPHLERRAALRVAVSANFGEVDVVNTHLGLRPSERALQTRALVEDWLSHVQEGSSSILCGDLNAIPGSYVHRTFARLLQDAARPKNGRAAAKTWPAFLPIVRLDHVFVGAGFDVVESRVPLTRAERIASDHLPVVVDLSPRGPAS